MVLKQGLAPSESDVLVNLNDDPDVVDVGDLEMQPNGTRGRTVNESADRAGLGPAGGGLSCYCGVLTSDKVDNLERILWRISRGNIFFRWMDIGEMDDPESVITLVLLLLHASRTMMVSGRESSKMRLHHVLPRSNVGG